MNGLLWKEWRENRLVVVWVALLTWVLLVGFISLSIVNQSVKSHIIDKTDMETFLDIIWCFSALLCSSAMMAREIGSGALQFLSALPISRKRVWWTKLLTCLGLVALALAASTLVYIGVYAVASHFGIMDSPLKGAVQDLRQQSLGMLCVTLPLCAFGMAVTVLMDRTISALMTSIIAAVALIALFSGIASIPGTPWYETSAVWWVVGGLSVPIFLTVSYQTFLYGETLRTSARFKIAIPAFLLSVGIIAIVLTIAYYWIIT